MHCCSLFSIPGTIIILLVLLRPRIFTGTGTGTAGFILDRPGVPSRTIFTKHTKS
jgi:hypothetical protein